MPLCQCGHPIKYGTAKSAKNFGREYMTCNLGDAIGCGFIGFCDEHPDYRRFDEVVTVGPHTIVRMCEPFAATPLQDNARCFCGLPSKKQRFGRFVCKTKSCKFSKQIILPPQTIRMIAEQELSRPISEIEQQLLDGTALEQNKMVMKCRENLLENLIAL